MSKLSPSEKDYERFADLSSPSSLRWLDGVDFRQGRALHAGCGSGTSTVGLAQWFDEVVATDYNKHLIELAETAHPHPNIRYLNVDFVKHRDPIGFDLVFVYMTLHDVEPDEFDTALINVKDLAKEGGTVVIVDRIVDSKWRSHAQAIGSAIGAAPKNALQLGLRKAFWMLRYCLKPSRLSHLAASTHLSGADFERRYSTFFAGGEFKSSGHDRAVIWKKPLGSSG